MTSAAGPVAVDGVARRVVGIASSAGGLPGLVLLVSDLPRSFPGAVLVVQHLRPGTPSWLPAILGRRSALPVRLASDGDLLRPGVVLVGPADRHLVLHADGTVWLSPEAPVQFLRPSADRLFESLARVCGPDAIAVVLSGAGSDGAAGTRAVKSAGGTVIVEDATTAQFFGMPGAAVEVADMVLPIQEIAEALVSLTLERER